MKYTLPSPQDAVTGLTEAVEPLGGDPNAPTAVDLDALAEVLVAKMEASQSHAMTCECRGCDLRRALGACRPRRPQRTGELMIEFSNLVGKTLTNISGGVGDELMTFTVGEGEAYQMYHSQDCCEHVEVQDICGDLRDLIGSPIVSAEESSSDERLEGVEAWYDDSFTWTFYRMATAKGLVVIRWLGASNGYYSERVDFVRIGASDE